MLSCLAGMCAGVVAARALTTSVAHGVPHVTFTTVAVTVNDSAITRFRVT